MFEKKITTNPIFETGFTVRVRLTEIGGLIKEAKYFPNFNVWGYLLTLGTATPGIYYPESCLVPSLEAYGKNRLSWHVLVLENPEFLKLFSYVLTINKDLIFEKKSKFLGLFDNEVKCLNEGIEHARHLAE